MSGLLPQPPYPWLTDAWDNVVARDGARRLPHALLIVGPDGVGCLELARAMAQYLLCLTPQNKQVCGTCKACLLLRADAHPDLYTVYPEDGSAAIKIGQIRDINEVTAQTAQQGGRKVVVIHPAETMNANAANALLKNLEEPNGECVFLLVSEQPAFLMATVRSRCARIEVGLPTQEEALSWLQRNQVAQPENKLRNAKGRPLRVLDWLEKDIWGQRESLLKDLAAVIEGDSHFLDVSKRMLSYGVPWLIEQLLQWLQEAAVHRVSPTGNPPNALVGRLSEAPAPQVFRYYDRLLVQKQRVRSGANPNPQLVVDEILMGLKGITLKSS